MIYDLWYKYIFLTCHAWALQLFQFLDCFWWDLYTWRLRVLCGNDIFWHLLTHGSFGGKERSFTLAGFHGGSLTLFWWWFHIFFACSPYCKDWRERCSHIFGQGTFLKTWAAKKKRKLTVLDISHSPRPKNNSSKERIVFQSSFFSGELRNFGGVASKDSPIERWIKTTTFPTE